MITSNEVLNLFKLNKFKECIILINTLESSDDLNLIKAACFASLGETITATSILKTLIIQNPNNLMAINNLALILINNSRLEDAYSLLKYILGINDKYLDALLNIAILCKDLNKIEEGLYYFAKIYEMNKLNVSSANDYSILLARSGKLNEAYEIRNKFNLTYKYILNFNKNEN